MTGLVNWNWRPLAFGLGFLALTAGAYYLGRCTTLPSAAAASPGVGDARTGAAATKSAGAKEGDYSRQVVAYIYGSIPLTREDLGEYLIARQGADRLELMVNRRIIDLACQKKGIVVTDAEVETALADDLKSMNVLSVKDFVNGVLKRYQKTLYEWKEDVIRPKLALGKLCHDQVKVTEEDLHNAFEAYHGEKVECQMIVWPPSEKHHVFTETYAKIQQSEKEFNLAARTQANSALAAKEGHLEPFGRHATTNEEMEKEAFKLQPGEISRVIETPQGLIVLKCIKHIPAQAGVTLDDKERAKLEKEIIERKIALEIPKMFKQLRDQASPQLFLGKKVETEEDLTRQAREALTSDSPTGLPKHSPQGN
ncbi:MAG TPA: peptidylprolyl isomerase [Gemmataceae bacterium]|nr:peptidylprolyl isomerase [Gemmataceae bacterium]